MPYIHTGKNCNGEIGLWSRKCKKCGKRWPLMALFGYKPPKDMRFVVIPPEKQETKYAKWADKVPYAGNIASSLPNWPRWARILTALAILGGCIGLIFWMANL